MQIKVIVAMKTAHRLRDIARKVMRKEKTIKFALTQLYKMHGLGEQNERKMLSLYRKLFVESEIGITIYKLHCDDPIDLPRSRKLLSFELKK